MVPEDYEQMQKHFPLWKKDQNFHEICLLSPNLDEYKLIKVLFPKANIYICSIKNWNLKEESKKKYDLVCAMNVFHYSDNPDIWFKNVFQSCRYFWLQDLIIRCRSEKGLPFQLGKDGDAMRYCFLPEIRSTFENAFNLSVFKLRILNFYAYPVKGIVGNESLHFICNMKGDLGFGDVLPSNKFQASLFSLSKVFGLKIKRFGLNLRSRI